MLSLRQKRVPVTDWNSDSRGSLFCHQMAYIKKAQRVPQGPAELSCSGARHAPLMSSSIGLFDLLWAL